MITITINPETSSEMSIIGKALADILALSTTALEVPPAEAPKPVKASKSAKAPAEAPAATQPAAEPAPTAPVQPETVAASPSEPVKPITLEEVRAKLAALSQAGKTAAVKALISDAGASKLTEIPAEKYADVLAKAEAL